VFEEIADNFLIIDVSDPEVKPGTCECDSPDISLNKCTGNKEI